MRVDVVGDRVRWQLVPVDEEGAETIVTEVLATTQVVAAFESVVFRDRVYLDEALVEDTHDWVAQDDAGNLWHLG